MHGYAVGARRFCCAMALGVVAVVLLAPCCGRGLAAGSGTEMHVYTDEQAARGERVYERYCTSCHGGRLQGNPAAPLAGEAFLSRWADGQHTLDDLLYIIRTLMPYNAPASLTRQQYADVLAYVLKANGYPPGEAELVPSAPALKGSTLQPR